MTGAGDSGRESGQSPAVANESQRRRLLEQSLTTRFGLRMHMSLMLAAAFSVGFMSNFIMLRHAFVPLPWRWVIAYCIGYAVLFIAMRFWLAYVGVRPFTRSTPGSVLDAADAYNGPIYWPSGGGASGGGAGGFRGGGGSYGGGGASGNFDGAALAGGSSGSSHGGSHGGIHIGDLFDGDDAGKLVILIAVVALILAAFGGGIVFLIVSAPHLLVDMAFGAAITGGIVPATKRAAVEPQWEGSVWRTTWKPAVAMLLVLVVCALALHHYFPGVQTLGQAFASLR